MNAKKTNTTQPQHNEKKKKPGFQSLSGKHTHTEKKNQFPVSEGKKHTHREKKKPEKKIVHPKKKTPLEREKKKVNAE